MVNHVYRDMAASNLIEPGENVLVLNTGYFGDSFAECLEIYGAKVDQLGAPVGDKPTVQQIEEALKKKKYKMLTFTHVDTCEPTILVKTDFGCNS